MLASRLQPRTVQAVASGYTDNAIPAHIRRYLYFHTYSYVIVSVAILQKEGLVCLKEFKT